MIKIEEAVLAAMERIEAEDKKQVEAQVLFNKEKIEASGSVGLGNGWSIAAMWRKWLATGKSEAAVGVTKEF